jgi:CRP-like cAMP-binding protein/membrane protein YdbS with pleckstrin-like domain
MPGRIDFLRQLAVFSELNEAEIRDLARIAQEYEFDDGAVIAYQRDVANSMYIVREGRLYARSVDVNGVVRDSRSYLPGQHFGEQWLFAPATHPATIKGGGSGRIIIIDGHDFLEFLSTHMEALDALEPLLDEATGELIAGLPPEAWEEARKYRVRADRESAAINLLPDELVEYTARRSKKWLFLTEILPIMGLLLGVPLVYGLLSGLGPPWDAVANVIAILLGAVFLLISAVEVLDWYLDYFVITNKHLTHREFDLRRFRLQVSKVPIHQIQSVQTLKPDLISNILGVGTARITTASPVGTLYFTHIDNPIQVEETLNRLTARVRALSQAENQAVMRQSLEDYFQVAPAYRRISEEDVSDRPPDAAEHQPSFWNSILNRYRWRVVDGDVTTYRKHFFVLLKQTFWPLVFGMILVASLLLLIPLLGWSGLEIWLVYGFLFLANLGWFIWKVEDWRNDTFQVTSRFVIDIDRKPFGFGESRKQAALSNIQNVTADRPDILATIFNYGFVQVETAGAVSDIEFEYVSNPSEIQSDIFRRLDEFQQEQRRNEGRQRRKEYAVLLDVYKQATEQNRIPRRTPDESDLEEV